ncbi:MAG: ATP-binding cassette domain-containing protein [Lachnospiraceae bacterium]|nr:ATP-binding cassette domain-containing protein [Lachnospiraceae bacterium]
MLKINDISKTFNPGTVNEKTALSHLSLTVNDGDFISIIGSNGAGKSTLFNAIAGTFLVDEGSIELAGEDITFVAEHVRARTIGRLFQDPQKGTAPDMSIEENLALAAGSGGWLSRISKKEKAALRERVALLNMGLEDRMESPVGLLSGGQRQALTLLMATINPPKLLLLDEHTAALDPATSAKVTELTEKIVSENSLTCLVITHNMQAALTQGNRTLMMEGGNIIFDISGSERENMTVDDLLDKFRTRSGHVLDNDRMLLSDS